MSNTNDGGSRGSVSIGFSGLLAIAFIVLKLCHVIDWPWVWVLSPIWISLIIFVIIIGIAIKITNKNDHY